MQQQIYQKLYFTDFHITLLTYYNDIKFEINFDSFFSYIFHISDLSFYKYKCNLISHKRFNVDEFHDVIYT